MSKNKIRELTTKLGDINITLKPGVHFGGAVYYLHGLVEEHSLVALARAVLELYEKWESQQDPGIRYVEATIKKLEALDAEELK